MARLLVSDERQYAVRTTADARRVAAAHIAGWGLDAHPGFGLPEVDDRYHVWRVPLVAAGGRVVGEVVVDARSSAVVERRSSSPAHVAARLALGPRPGEPAVPAPDDQPAAAAGDVGPRHTAAVVGVPPGHAGTGLTPPLPDLVILGDSRESLAVLPPESVDLVFTSPPYFNARPDYSGYVAYEEYLETIRAVIRQVHRVLADGRFFVMNTAPVLVRRASRSHASRRIAVPFDLHRVFVEEGFDFVDDIVWVKPEGAGWATGRGRRFAADRNPLQYKAVPVTEYVLVYRRHTDRLIDWHIRNHADRAAVERSRIDGEYDRTNVWHITPASSREHPAVFPVELARRVIRYWSFEGDVVLDPFAGIGTVGEAAAAMNRRFVLAECEPDYVAVIRRRAPGWLGDRAASLRCIGCGTG